MQFAILENSIYRYTIIYKEKDTYYYSLPKNTIPTGIYWNNNIQKILDNSTIIISKNPDMPNWIKHITSNDIVWLDIDKPENMPIQYPELFI